MSVQKEKSLSASPGESQALQIDSPDGRSLLVRGAGRRLRVADYLQIALPSQPDLLGFVESVSPGPDNGFLATGSLVGGAFPSPTTDWSTATVRLADSDAVAAVLAGSEPDHHLGYLVARPDVGVALVPKRLNRHTFWCGQSGSGKTYALGVLLERILLTTRLPVVIFDPNSDFVAIDQSTLDADPDVAARLRQRDIVVLRPGDEDSPLRVRFRNFSARAKAAVLRLDPVVDRAEYNALIRLSSVLANDDAAEVVPHLRALGEPDGTALAQRIENLGLLEWTKIWAAKATAATEVIGQRPAATVLDLGGYDRHEEQLTVALAVLDDLWERRAERRPVLLVVDEAHNLCPPDPGTPLGRAVRDRLVQIAAEGRKYGLWLLMSTQRPSKVHQGVVSQCDNLTLMRMNSREDLAELAVTFGFVPEALMAQAARFRQGEALLAGGFVPMPSVVRIRDRVTQEGGIDVPVPLA